LIREGWGPPGGGFRAVFGVPPEIGVFGGFPPKLVFLGTFRGTSKTAVFVRFQRWEIPPGWGVPGRQDLELL